MAEGLSERYDRFYKDTGAVRIFPEVCVSGWPRDRYQAMVATAGTGDTLLDIGCGDGFLISQFRTRYRKLVGLEYSSSRLAQAVRNLSQCDFRPVQGSAEDMSTIPSTSVDCIISADTIEHIPDVYAAVREMRRVLRPGGRLIMNTPNVAFLKKRLLLLAGRFPSTSQPNEGLGSDILFDGGHLHYFTYRSLRLLLEREGFRITSTLGFGKFGRIHNLYSPLTSVAVHLEAVPK